MGNSYIKSITTTQHKNAWVCRVRFVQGTEKIIGAQAGYTMHQAQALADSVRRDLKNFGASVLDSYN